MSIADEKNKDIISSDLASAFADGSQSVDLFQLDRVHKVLNRYDQWGFMMGTFKDEKAEEIELYFWTCRTRILEISQRLEDELRATFFMYFNDGYPIKIEILFVRDLLINYKSGYTIVSSGGREKLTNIEFEMDSSLSQVKRTQLTFTKSKTKNEAIIQFTDSRKFQVGADLNSTILVRNFKVSLDNGDEGYGALHLQKRRDSPIESKYQPPPLLLKEKNNISTEKSIVSLDEDLCTSSTISGGKGSSLALLTSLSKATQKFIVPKGFVITTAAFEKHIKNHPTINISIRELVKVIGKGKNADLKIACSRCVEEFQAIELTNVLKDEIKNVLLESYESLENVKFSIRSSAQGEDSEDLSAAGQMLTVLGVRGIHNILDGLVKCWSSKFTFESVQYSRQNGQSILCPMAVVIQEMVPSEVSGVLFTVDPVTGNPLHPCITANYGLGESVVSSLVEPDTITLHRHPDHTVTVHEKVIGSKKAQIHMSASDGTEERLVDTENPDSCLSDEWSKKIGSAGLLIESCFGTPRDIEWAVYKNDLYLLQARPVTTLHTETDYELMHDQDTPVRSDNEYWTRANTGEVFLGATSPLGISLIVGGMDILSHRNQITRERRSIDFFCPYYLHVLPVSCRQVCLNFVATIYRDNEKEISSRQKAFEIGLFGRVIANKDIHKEGVKKFGYTPKWRRLLLYGFLLFFFFKIPGLSKRAKASVEKQKLSLEKCTTPMETWKTVLQPMKLYNEVCNVHGFATFLSSVLNFVVISILSRDKPVWDIELYQDFAKVLSSCTGVESADVPESLQNLGKVIAKYHGAAFVSLPVNMAYNVLNNDKGPAGKLFREFLDKHGHRCIKEFDCYSVSWEMNPVALIPILQNIVASPINQTFVKKEEVSIEKIISELKTPVVGWNKRLLSFFLPLSRQLVRTREATKSVTIREIGWYRHMFYHLGSQMVEEGMLPNRELVFFLTLEEIRDVLLTRRPGLVHKAVRRMKLHDKLDKMQFPEIMKGVPKPMENDKEKDMSKYKESFTLTGFPVCHGKVKAVARVVTTLEEANTIQNGDILITHSTDIGWSPYFPLLSGVVTVLGGLISHGAVVAREYGLPCVVGVEKATAAFNSGDIVVLDGNKGTITKILVDQDTEL